MLYARKGEILVKKRHLRVVGTTTVNRNVRPRRRKNADLRTREYLTRDEVSTLIEAARNNRYGHRDASSAGAQVDLDNARLHVQRGKNGVPSVPPQGRRNASDQAGGGDQRVCVGLRAGSPFTTAGFAKLIRAKSWMTSQNQLTGNGAL
jgi:hypothetical protein